MFKEQISQFNKNLLDLRDFVDLIDPILLEKYKETEKDLQPFILVGLINRILNNPDFKSDEQTPGILKIKENIEKKLEEKYKGKVDVEIRDAKKVDDGITVEGLTFKTAPEAATYIEQLINKPDHRNFLYKTSFISLISSVEWFFSQILHTLYSNFPEKALLDKKMISFDDLKDFDNIKDAEQFLIDEKIENILRDKVENWFELLSRELNLNMGYLASTKKNITEIFQRRNLIIHNGGIVNSIYLSRIDPSLKNELSINDSLGVSKEYLDFSIETLQTAFILFSLELWKKNKPGDKERGNLLVEIVYENVEKGWWNIAEGLSFFLLQDAKMDNIDKLLGQINNWLCQKRLGKNDAVQKELKDIDFSDKQLLFQLALVALKDDKATFFELLPMTMDKDELNAEKLQQFPIFEEMRLTEEFQNFKNDSKYFRNVSEKPIQNDIAAPKIVIPKKQRASKNKPKVL